MCSLNFKKIIIICVCVIIFGSVFGFVIFPKTLEYMITKQLQLKPDSQIRSLYTKVPFPIDFRIYVFNVTNKEEMIAGGKPKVQQIGPYYFEEWKEKFDLEDNDEEDSFSFNYKNTFIFRQELSNGLTGNEIITVPHTFIWNMVLGVNVDKKPMLPTIQDAINELFHNPTDSFWTGRAMDLLFDGITVDCRSQHVAAQGICSQFATGDVKIVRVDAVTYKFSLFGAVNGTGLGKFKVHRGIKNIADLGRVMSFEGDTEMDTWDDDECNQYKGTDSTIFPPFLKKEQGLWAHEPSMCRSLGARYVKPSSYAGIPTWQYTLDFGDTRADPKLHCYCMDPPHDCPHKGTYELFKCVGAPLVASMPHFYDADPSLLDKIIGLNPNKNEHAIYLEFVALSGAPISAAKRLQFNIDVVPVKEIPIMSGFQKMIMPLFWVEEAASINQTYVDQMHQLFTMITINEAIKYICIILGTIGAIISTFMYCKEKGNTSWLKGGTKTIEVAK